MNSDPLRSLGIRTFEQLQQDNKNSPRGYLVDGLLFEDSVNISVGDSGLGKSPWHYQLALSVIAGQEFMGRRILHPGPVIYADFENNSEIIEETVTRLSAHMGLPAPKSNLLTLTDPDAIDSPKKIEQLCLAVQPAMFIIDPLRCWAPDGESKQENAAKSIGSLRAIARRLRTVFDFVHHIRKNGRTEENKRPHLINTQAIEWLQEASGARGLINQTDTRIAFDIHNDDLIVRYNRRSAGDFGPYFFSRACQDGEPVGYDWRRGKDLLNNRAMELAYDQLPSESSYSTVKNVYGKGDSATVKFINKCLSAGLLERRNGHYARTCGVSGVN